MNLINWIIIYLLLCIILYLLKSISMESFGSNSNSDLIYQFDNNNLIIYGYNDTNNQTYTINYYINGIEHNTPSFNVTEIGYFTKIQKLDIDRTQTNNITINNDQQEKTIEIPNQIIQSNNFSTHHECKNDGSFKTYYGSPPHDTDIPTKPEKELDTLHQTLNNESQNIFNVDLDTLTLYQEPNSKNDNKYNLDFVDTNNKSFNEEIKELLDKFK
jgi:hypothetical protein